MLYDHAHAMQVKLCKANTRGVTSISIIVPLGTTNGFVQGSIGPSAREYSETVPYLYRDALLVE